MIPYNIKEKLKAQWGEAADTMEAFCLCCLCIEKFRYYIFAIDPSDEDMIRCMYESPRLYDTDFLSSFDELKCFTDHIGAEMTLDNDFRPIKASVLCEKIRKKYES